MGSEVSEVGTVRRSCNGTGRIGDVRVMGVIDMIGLAVLIGILLDRPMSACSMRGIEVDCIGSSLPVVLVNKRFALLVANCEKFTSEMYGDPIKMELKFHLIIKYRQLHSHFICSTPRRRPRRSLPHRANLANLKAKLQTP